MQPDQAIIDRWNGSAPFWGKHHETIRQIFAPVMHALVEDAHVGSGQTVLDVATGPGEPALSVAALTGPTGKVFGVDPAAEMVAAARRAAIQLGFGNTQFDVAFADHLPFPADTFDAVVSRFGVMFFPSPPDAVREILRVLKPGRKLAMAVWSFAEQNPFLTFLSKAFERYIDWPPVPPDAPEPFRFASPGKLLAIFREAGAIEPSERLVRFAVHAEISIEEFWTLRCEMSEKFREAMAKLSTEQLAEAKREGLEALREYSTDRGINIPAEVLIVTGTKARPA